MASSNGIIKLLVVGLLANSDNSSGKNTSRGNVLFNLMVGLFLFSVIGTAISYNSINDRKNIDNYVTHTMLKTLVDCNIVEVKAPSYYDEIGAKEYIQWKLSDFSYETPDISNDDYIHERKSCLQEYFEENAPLWLKISGNPLSALLFLMFSIISFIILLFPLCFAKTKISENLLTGERNSLDFMKATSSLIKNRLFFKGFMDADSSHFLDSYLTGRNIEALKYIFDKHNNGIVVKLQEKNHNDVIVDAPELLKAPRFDKLGKIATKFTIWSILLIIFMTVGISHGIIWAIAFFWLPFAVYFIYTHRKHVVLGTNTQTDCYNIEDLFQCVGIQLVEQKISNESIEASFLSHESIAQIKKELEDNPNKSYFRTK